jgi:hypothetical protein
MVTMIQLYIPWGSRRDLSGTSVPDLDKMFTLMEKSVKSLMFLVHCSLAIDASPTWYGSRRELAYDPAWPIFASREF